MKLLSDFFPIILFFATYKLYDIYVATAVVMAATLAQVGYGWLRHRKVESMQWITLVLIIIMGGLTLYLKDEQFIKWKLSIIEWLFGAAFLSSQFIGDKTLVERMLAANLALPQALWRRLNLVWAVFFIGVGFVNLYVMHYFSTDDWVVFKTFGVPGLMALFIIAQAFYLYKHVPEPKE